MFEKEPALRRLAAAALALNCDKGDKQAHNALLRALDDPNPAVQRAIVLAIGQINGPGASDALVTVLSLDTGKDSRLSDGIVQCAL